MNERIMKLAIQAREYAESKPDIYAVAYDKKFAELIVKECCQYLNSEAERLWALSTTEHRPNFKEDFEICAEKCYDNIQGIKDHFGIEE